MWKQGFAAFPPSSSFDRLLVFGCLRCSPVRFVRLGMSVFSPSHEWLRVLFFFDEVKEEEMNAGACMLLECG